MNLLKINNLEIPLFGWRMREDILNQVYNILVDVDFSNQKNTLYTQIKTNPKFDKIVIEINMNNEISTLTLLNCTITSISKSSSYEGNIGEFSMSINFVDSIKNYNQKSPNKLTI